MTCFHCVLLMPRCAIISQSSLGHHHFPSLPKIVPPHFQSRGPVLQSRICAGVHASTCSDSLYFDLSTHDWVMVQGEDEKLLRLVRIKRPSLAATSASLYPRVSLKMPEVKMAEMDYMKTVGSWESKSGQANSWIRENRR